MTLHQAQEVALKYGAKQYCGHPQNAAVQCWIDRVAYLPVAAERGKLVEAVLEANKYA